MLELSLHVLDLMENAVRAGAQTVLVSIEEDTAVDRLSIAVEDDGPGLPVPGDEAASPFFTTKADKKTGLGLSLFRHAAELAGGGMTLGASSLGGAAVRVTMGLSHVDRVPLGDLAATVLSIILTHGELDVRCRLSAGGHTVFVSSSEIGRQLEGGGALEVAIAVGNRLRAGLEELGMTA